MVRSKEELELLWHQTCLCSFRSGYKSYKGFTLPQKFSEIQELIENFEVYDDDIWVTSYPKCGTTWTQEMVWCIANDVNLEAAKVDLNLRFPFLESCHLVEYEKLDLNTSSIEEISVEYTKNCTRPRFIKTHLPWDLLPKQIQNFERNPKIINVTRNVKDACVSFYHHSRIFEGYTGDLDLFSELFINNKIGWTPYFKNILSYWNKRNEANIHFIKYKDMKQDLRAVINKTAVFLNKQLTENQIQVLLDHLSFNSMKNNIATNKSSDIEYFNIHNMSVDKEGKFLRSGVNDSYKTEMSQQIIDMFDAWIKEENLENNE